MITKNMKISQKLIAASILSTIFLGLVGFFGVTRMNIINDN
ncbi:MCP four helix bundle domain-containing protein [Clostridium sp. Sa3CVN1]|uniref:MCP four helix bundle domain-containing protein n=1 Tax=Clostridium cibarium TaxID=2762247 RepID=A0ABR8PSZ6_9CLOT|nr:MCP four helix bundle domain-containing protein [Clostridium cibarium]